VSMQACGEHARLRMGSAFVELHPQHETDRDAHLAQYSA
jgi:hypothetical protein